MIDKIKEYALRLDAQDFQGASALLADDCRYAYSEGRYQGRDAIQNIHQKNHEQYLRYFDKVEYASEVEPIDPSTFKVQLFDRLYLGDHRHESESYQLLTVEAGEIVGIEHFSIPGQAESLHAFFLQHRETR